jgi:MFS family permease
VDSLEQKAVAKAARRLIPLLILSYFTAYLDRVNVAFAGPAMMRDLALSASVFGAGAGIFFIGYVIFEVPSNLALHRFGARRWITRIMFSWGALSAATALTAGEISFYAIRFALGVAEAGFFPGVVLYLSVWFPPSYRARVVGWFLLAVPASAIIGAPLSGVILEIGDAGGLKAWQWLFIIEAAPALLLAAAVWRFLPDLPANASWLTPGERDVLVAAARKGAAKDISLSFAASPWRALLDRRILALGFIYMCVLIPNYAIGFFLPQIIAAFGTLNPVEAGLVNAVPFVFGAFAMILWVRQSDRLRERKWHIALPALLMAAGFAGAAFADALWLKIAAVSLASFGFGITPVFWTIPATFLSGAAAAAGIAAINALGNLGGYFGPQIFGLLTDGTGSAAAGMLFLSAAGIAVCGLALWLGRARAFEEGR